MLAVLLSQFVVLMLVQDWNNPRANNRPTAFMAADPGAIHPWVDVDNISRNMLVAIIAHEDAPFPDRAGAFSVHQFAGRAKAFLTSSPDPSGSTLDQQLAKNLHLSPDRSAVRKALEADLSTVMAFTMDKKRRLELYANTSQFGTGLYGVCGASWYYFGEAPAKLTLDQSAQLVGLLPNPTGHPRGVNGGVTYHAGNGTAKDMGDIVAWARVHVPEQVKGVGGLRATEAIGITGFAETHVGGVKCATMPVEVAAKLVADKQRTVAPAPIAGLPLVASAPKATKVAPVSAPAGRADGLVKFSYGGKSYLAKPGPDWSKVWAVTKTGGRGPLTRIRIGGVYYCEIWGLNYSGTTWGSATGGTTTATL
ncbi:MAG: transglycosylase domain-containing protein [Propionicimonas sp.]